jgi:uncharacterized protein (TIGR02611 family)
LYGFWYLVWRSSFRAVESIPVTEKAQVKSGGVTAQRDEGKVAATTFNGGLGSRAPGFIKRSRLLHLSWQVVVFVLGLAIVAAGVLLLPLPGPGWVVIFAGMALWATEFVWAQLVLRWTKRKVTAAAQRALDPSVRRRNMTLTVITLVLIGAGVGYYVSRFGLQMPWRVG